LPVWPGELPGKWIAKSAWLPELSHSALARLARHSGLDEPIQARKKDLQIVHLGGMPVPEEANT
jgi:hypothetical protein